MQELVEIIISVWVKKMRLEFLLQGSMKSQEICEKLRFDKLSCYRRDSSISLIIDSLSTTMVCL